MKPWPRLLVQGSPPSDEQIEQQCGQLRRPPVSDQNNGWILFPNQSKDTQETASAPEKDIQAGLRGSMTPGTVGLSLVVCVDYTLSFVGTKAHHQTRQGYLVGFLDPKTGAAMGAFNPNGQYPRVAIYLEPGGATD